jgi:hypothetical protein
MVSKATTCAAGVAITAAFFAAPLLAQDASGGIKGHVVDQQHSVLPGVLITLTGENGSRKAISSEAGRFGFENIPPGTYTATAELAGFRTREKSIVITTGPTSELEFVLAVGCNAIIDLMYLTYTVPQAAREADVIADVRITERRVFEHPMTEDVCPSTETRYQATVVEPVKDSAKVRMPLASVEWWEDGVPSMQVGDEYIVLRKEDPATSKSYPLVGRYVFLVRDGRIAKDGTEWGIDGQNVKRFMTTLRRAVASRR